MHSFSENKERDDFGNRFGGGRVGGGGGGWGGGGQREIADTLNVLIVASAFIIIGQLLPHSRN